MERDLNAVKVKKMKSYHDADLHFGFCNFHKIHKFYVDVLLLELWKINCLISDMLLPKTTFYKNKLEVKSRKNCKT